MNLRFSVNYDFQRNQMFAYVYNTNISVIQNPVEINGLSINPDWCRISLKFTMLMVKLFDKNISSLLLVCIVILKHFNGNRCLQGVNYNSKL